jgi:hypothetical protein
MRPVLSIFHVFTVLQELYGPEDRKKLAIFTALTFSQKLSGLPPETIFSALMSDSLIAKGIVLYFVTDTFKVYLVENSLDDLVSLLKRAKMDDRLLDLFPMQKRSIEGFAEHFKYSHCADPLVAMWCVFCAAR